MTARGPMLIALLLSPLRPLAEAAPRPPGAEALPELFSVAYLAQVLGSLLLVFMCLFAVVLLLRRVNRLGPDAAGPLRVIGSASVGQREKIVLVAAGEQQLLLGVAPGAVRTLHVLKEPVVAASAPALDFAAVLRAANPLAHSAAHPGAHPPGQRS